MISLRALLLFKSGKALPRFYLDSLPWSLTRRKKNYKKPYGTRVLLLVCRDKYCRQSGVGFIRPFLRVNTVLRALFPF